MDYKKNLWTAVLVLIVGIVLVFFSSTTVETIVRILGSMFVIAAVLNVCMQLGRTKPKADNRRGSSMVGMLTAIASGALGLWMLVAPSSLVSLLVYLFAALLILAGIYQICTLSLSYKPVRFPFGFYILPALLVVFGIVMIFMGPARVANTLTILIGIGMIAYAISMFIEIGGVTAYRRSMRVNESVDYRAGDGKGATDNVKAEEVKSVPKSSPWPSDKK